jgi:hypothetical protein
LLRRCWLHPKCNQGVQHTHLTGYAIAARCRQGICDGRGLAGATCTQGAHGVLCGGRSATSALHRLCGSCLRQCQPSSKTQLTAGSIAAQEAAPGIMCVHNCHKTQAGSRCFQVQVLLGEFRKRCLPVATGTHAPARESSLQPATPPTDTHAIVGVPVKPLQSQRSNSVRKQSGASHVVGNA